MAIYRSDPVLREAARVLRMAAIVLEDDDEDGDAPFQQILRSPKELRDPDLTRAHRLDRLPEAQGLDRHRDAEDVEPVEMPVRD